MVLIFLNIIKINAVTKIPLTLRKRKIVSEASFFDCIKQYSCLILLSFTNLPDTDF